MTPEQTPQTLDLRQVQTVLHEQAVEISIDDNRNPVEIAAGLGLITMLLIDEVQPNHFDSVQRARLINAGQLIVQTEDSQRVLQAVLYNPAST